MPSDIAREWLALYASAFASSRADAVASLFLPQGWLRDVLTFTWDTRSLEGRQKIEAYLNESNALKKAQVRDFKLAETLSKTTFTPIPKPDGTVEEGVEAFFTFETWVGHARGCVRLLKDNTEGGEWRALSVLMVLEEIRGHEEAGFESGIYGGHTLAWSDVKAERRERIEKDPHVLISEPFPDLSRCIGMAQHFITGT